MENYVRCISSVSLKKIFFPSIYYSERSTFGRSPQGNVNVFLVRRISPGVSEYTSPKSNKETEVG